MKTMLLAVALALALAGGAPGLFADTAWSWSTSLDTILSVGDTRYLMEELGLGVSSELIFPLETLLAGITFRGERQAGRRDGQKDWAFEASVAVNLLSPFGKMTDSDWFMSSVYPKAAFSYTESDMTMLWLLAGASLELVLAERGWGQWAAVLGYRLQYVSQKANGYIGWYYEDDDGDDLYELWGSSYSGLALTYRVLWNLLTAGLDVVLRPAPGLSVQAGAGAGLAYVADKDDHVLRYKLSTASGLGVGGYGELEVRYAWGKGRARPYLSLCGNALYMGAKTRQTQTYYEGAIEQPPGTSWSGIDHQLSTRQFSVVLACGASY